MTHAEIAATTIADISTEAVASAQPLKSPLSQAREASPLITKNPNHLDRCIFVDGRKAPSRELAKILLNGEKDLYIT